MRSLLGKPFPMPAHPLGRLVRSYAGTVNPGVLAQCKETLDRAASFWDVGSNVWAASSLNARQAATGDSAKTLQRTERRLAAAAEVAERDMHVQWQAACVFRPDMGKAGARETHIDDQANPDRPANRG